MKLLRKRQTEPMCKTPVVAYYNERTNKYTISIGMTRYTGLDLHDLNAILRVNKINRDSIDWHGNFSAEHRSFWLRKYD